MSTGCDICKQWPCACPKREPCRECQGDRHVVTGYEGDIEFTKPCEHCGETGEEPEGDD